MPRIGRDYLYLCKRNSKKTPSLQSKCGAMVISISGSSIFLSRLPSICSSSLTTWQRSIFFQGFSFLSSWRPQQCFTRETSLPLSRLSPPDKFSYEYRTRAEGIFLICFHLSGTRGVLDLNSSSARVLSWVTQMLISGLQDSVSVWKGLDRWNCEWVDPKTLPPIN